MDLLIVIVITPYPQSSVNIYSHNKNNTNGMKFTLLLLCKVQSKKYIDGNYSLVYIMEDRNQNFDSLKQMSIFVKIVLFPSDQSSGILAQYQFSLTCGINFQFYNPTRRLFSSIMIYGYLQCQLMKRLNQIYTLVWFILRINFLFNFIHQSKIHAPEIFVTIRELFDWTGTKFA